jgi:adenylosuccinate synthase
VTRITVVVGAQFGSEGKGAICGHLGKSMFGRDVAVRVAGPNAGHTVRDANGKEWKLRSLPVAAVTSRCQLHIAAGSEIDVDVTLQEIEQLDRAGHRVSERLTIHPSATIIIGRYKEAEGRLVNAIGSTGKGIGAARAARIMRDAATAVTIPSLKPWITDGALDLTDLPDSHVVVEGTQGYGLGLHTHYYPQVTSSDCRAIDFLAMAGLSPWHREVSETRVIVVARAFPIRVAGNSGPLLSETTWAELGLAEERTTVTNNIRRVGQWDDRLVSNAIAANGGGDWNESVRLALTMFDHRFPELANQTELEERHVEALELMEEEFETDIDFVGTGPDTVVER